MTTRQYPIHQVATSQPSSAILGDEWFNPTVNKLYKFLATSGTPQWVEIPSGSTSSGTSYPSSATQMAVGNSTQRPTNPYPGMVRYNTDLNSLEVYVNGSWSTVAISGSSLVNGYTINYLIVAGGGGGGAGIAGAANGGGGGAGGLLQGSLTINSGITYTVTVGAGGANCAQGSNSAISNNWVLSNSFSNFANLIAVGGGGGCSTVTGTIGGSGGAGGSAPFATGFAGVLGQGYSGANSTGASPGFGGGGGGGAGGPGYLGSGAGGGAGGPGLPSAISGTLTYYAGGGGGSSTSAYPIGQGGQGGGGRGGTGASALIPSAGAAGNTNTGGGGGGSNSVSGAVAGPSGGSGIVIISYANPFPRSSSGTVTSYTQNNVTFWVHTFTTSSTYIA